MNPKAEEELFQAAKDGATWKVRELIEQGVDFRAKNEMSLRYAVEGGHVEIVELLLDHGADISVVKDKPLVLAAGNNDLKMVELLLNRGANKRIDQDWPLRWAHRGKLQELSQLLVRYYTAPELRDLRALDPNSISLPVKIIDDELKTRACKVVKEARSGLSDSPLEI
jgi:ankyrin repeat protein